jgi:hypothetical protein
MIFGIFLLVCLFILWKLFAEGWLFKIILFCAGWVGLFVIMMAYTDCGKNTAVTLGNGTHLSWAFIVPSIICVLCLLFTRVKD